MVHGLQPGSADRAGRAVQRGEEEGRDVPQHAGVGVPHPARGVRRVDRDTDGSGEGGVRGRERGAAAGLRG